MAFSEIEKTNISARLLENCEESWSRFGYKKTSIDDLCAGVGISKGAFYLFYASKEELFFDVIMHVQERLVKLVKTALGDRPTKGTLAAALKLVYREYIKIPFILEVNSPDFIAFMNRLPKEKIEELAFHGNYDIRNIIKSTNLQYKIEEDKGVSAFGVLFMSNPAKREMPYDEVEVIDFMIDTMIAAVFE